MDENHQDSANNSLVTTENKIWLPPTFSNNNKVPIANGQAPTQRKAGSKRRWGLSGKTGWDLLNLIGVLAIPFVIAAGTLFFTQQITLQQAQLSEEQHQSDQQIALDNRQQDLQIATDQQRETTLKTCMDDMKDLLLNRNLRASKTGDEVRTVARAEVLSALRQLDGERKGALMRFLSEAGLITINQPGDTSNRNDVVINLKGADLNHANLSETYLEGVNLESANLSQAILQRADLSRAILDFANLQAADLSGTTLDFAGLQGSDLSDASLVGASLKSANLGEPYPAFLDQTDLNHADLSGSYLKGVTITQEQLNSTVDLQGATMPDGSIHP